jgi:uncharacterized membrane protein YqiK
METKGSMSWLTFELVISAILALAVLGIFLAIFLK